jgi:oxidase EvaA
VRVRADNREVSGWTQPLLAPRRQGFAALLTRPFDGVLHVLMCARPEPGLPEMVELGPTVQLPSWGDGNPAGTELYGMCTDGLRFDSVLSEEGGRFHHARTRYQIVDAGDELAADVPADFIWLTVHQIMRLLQHGRYLNVEARSLLACLHSLW